MVEILREHVLAIVARHRRHVEQSPGVGVERQTYALDVLDDVQHEMESLPDAVNFSVGGAAERPADQPVQNTDRELWRERPGDYYADSLFVTEGGGIGMNVGGVVVVKPIREWHAALRGAERSAGPKLLSPERPCRGCKGDMYHYAGCAYGEHGSREANPPVGEPREPPAPALSLRALFEQEKAKAREYIAKRWASAGPNDEIRLQLPRWFCVLLLSPDDKEAIHGAINSLWYSVSTAEFKLSSEDWSAICRDFSALRRAVRAGVPPTDDLRKALRDIVSIADEASNNSMRDRLTGWHAGEMAIIARRALSGGGPPHNE